MKQSQSQLWNKPFYERVLCTATGKDNAWECLRQLPALQGIWLFWSIWTSQGNIVLRECPCPLRKQTPLRKKDGDVTLVNWTTVSQTLFLNLWLSLGEYNLLYSSPKEKPCPYTFILKFYWTVYLRICLRCKVVIDWFTRFPNQQKRSPKVLFYVTWSRAQSENMPCRPFYSTTCAQSI